MREIDGLIDFLDAFLKVAEQETQTWLSRHYKFISVENITILSVSSDDFLDAFLELAEQETQTKVVIINLFRRRILQYSPSRQMTF